MKVEQPQSLALPLVRSKLCDLFTLANGKGHENMGIVEELGEGVTLLKKGDRVVMPFNVADGRCRNCEEGKTAFCTGVNPGFAGGAYGKLYTTRYFPWLTATGYVAMGPYRGGMFVKRVPIPRRVRLKTSRSSTVYPSSLCGFQCSRIASGKGT